MVRFLGNPILEPIKSHDWESRYVFNPGVVQLGDRIHIFYRAMGDDIVSRLGYASTRDGYHIDERLSYPVFEPTTPYERRGCEDPRLTLLDDRCLMTYTTYGDIFQIGITSIDPENVLKKRWNWGERLSPFPNIRNKNAAIFPQKFGGDYVLLHRLEPNICIARSRDLRTWINDKIIMRPRRDSWDCVKIGAAGPPLEIDNGWLLIYHGVDRKKVYRLGVAVLDKNSPEKVIYRSSVPILEPREDYELYGQIPNVIFSCGSLLVDDELLIYYGGADTVIGVVTYKLEEIITN